MEAVSSSNGQLHNKMMLCRMLCVLLLTYVTVCSAISDVPTCCPKGQNVATVSTNDGFDEFNCSDSTSEDVLELMGSIPISQLHLSCPSLLRRLLQYKKNNNVTLGSRIMKLSALLGSDSEQCFDFSDDEKVYLYSCDVEYDEPDGSPRPPKASEVKWTYTICSGLSITLLIAIAIIYGTDKALRSNPHGPYIVSHNVALAMTYVCRITLQFIAISEDFVDCKLIGFAMQCFTLCAFFWMNAMYIDVYLATRKMIPSMHTFDAKFCFLAIYAWGVPLLITTTSIFAEYLDSVPKESQFKPNIAQGGYSCFFTGRAKWIYFKGPLFFTVAVNITLFTLTAIGFFRNRRSADFLQPNSRLRSERRYFFVYVKLFIIMGLCWSFGWLLDTGIKLILPSLGLETLPDSLSYIYVLIDLVFCLQGVFVFLLLLWKKDSLGRSLVQSISVMHLAPRADATGRDDEESLAFSEMMSNTAM